MTQDNARSPSVSAEEPTPEEMNAAREVMQEVFSITVASGHDSGRGWPEEAHLHPIVKANRAAYARGRDEQRAVLGDIATACEDKDLRYFGRARPEVALKIIDYIHGAARGALAGTGALRAVLNNLAPHGTAAGRLDLYAQHREGCGGDEKKIACACGLIQSIAKFHVALEAIRSLGTEAQPPPDARVKELEVALRAARSVIDRDRTGLAAGLNAIRSHVQGWKWLAAGEWANYSWEEQNEKALRKEIGAAFDSIVKTLDDALRASGSLATESCREIDRVLRSMLGAAERPAPDAGAALSPFDRLCADGLADEVAVLVRRRVIDSRSPAADALLDYRNPPSSPRADRLAELEAQVAPKTPVPEKAPAALRMPVVIGESHDGWHLALATYPAAMDTACGKKGMPATRFETTDAARGHTFCIGCLNAWPEPRTITTADTKGTE